MKPSSKIVFFGSGPVAAATLSGLLQAGFEFEAIITKPRPLGHRGDVPILEFAEARKLNIVTIQDSDELSQLFATRKFKSSIGLVVDYGIIINKDVIDSFEKGILNSHFSLLPQWRGADPITFSVLSGQKITGVSLMLINESLDEGLLIAQNELPINPQVTTPELTDQLIELSNQMITKYLPLYLDSKITPYPQPSSVAPTYSRKLVKEDGALDLSKSATRLECEIRAYTGWPKSRLQLFGHQVIVRKARVASSKADGDLVIECGNGTYLELLLLTAPSGRTISGADFLRGYKK
jgi:methionyl-tRNA formyltransferase